MRKGFIGFVCFLLIASILFSSCATILSGGKTKIRVYDGTPANANVYVDGNYVGTAPCKFKVHKTMKNAQHKISSRLQVTKRRQLRQIVSLVLDFLSSTFSLV